MKRVLSKNLLIIVLALCGVMLLSISFVFAYDKNLKVRMSLANITLSSDCKITMAYGAEGTQVPYYDPKNNSIDKDAITPISSSTLSLTFNTPTNIALQDSYFIITNNMTSSALQLRIIGYLINDVEVSLHENYGGVVAINSSSNSILFPNTEYNKGAASTGYKYTYILEITQITQKYTLDLTGIADVDKVVNTTENCYAVFKKYKTANSNQTEIFRLNVSSSEFSLILTKMQVGDTEIYLRSGNLVHVNSETTNLENKTVTSSSFSVQANDIVKFTIYVVENFARFSVQSSFNSIDYYDEYATSNATQTMDSNFPNSITLLSPTKIKLTTSYNSSTNSDIYFKVTNYNTYDKNGNNAIQLSLTGLMVNGENVKISDEYSTVAEKTTSSTSTSIPLLICPKDFVSNIDNGNTVVLVLEVKKITPRYQLETSTDKFTSSYPILYNENGAISTSNTTVFPKNVIKKGNVFKISGELNIDSTPAVTEISYRVNNLIENQKLRLTVLSFEINNGQSTNVIRMDNNKDVTVDSVISNSVEQKKSGTHSYSSMITINIGSESNPTNGLRNSFPNYFASTGNPFVTITLSVEVIE